MSNDNITPEEYLEIENLGEHIPGLDQEKFFHLWLAGSIFSLIFFITSLRSNDLIMIGLVGVMTFLLMRLALRAFEGFMNIRRLEKIVGDIYYEDYDRDKID